MDATELEKAKEAARADIKVLVEKCERINANNELSKYIEERTRNELIDNLFEALGWDIDNRHTDDEVVRQESVKIRGSTKKVDYAFKSGGVTKFFVEAKGLREDLEDVEFAKQAIGYGFNRSIRYAVLTNFAKLKVFNCEWSEPNIVRNLVFELNFKHYLSSDFDKLWLLSKESFKTNGLDEYAKSIGKRTPSKEVADLLLEQMGIWRQKLSSDLSKRYGTKYPDYDIDEAVQRLLNRLIFMRHCEDRGIEEESLMAYLRQYEQTGKGLWARVHRLFSDYDGWYDSSLFRAPALIDQMELDDKLVADVIKSLYYTPDGNRRYNFALIPADILGNMYEQYLSHLLRKTPVRAKLEEKHAHRKEQGIYYTPTYIVDYIVKNTLGEMLKEMKPADAAKIRVLDPACGSGSFLLKVFDQMEQYHRKNSPDHAQSQLDATASNGRLTMQGRILRDNIFAVDLDPKAVEFAQLNLMLKAAETRAKLPMLDANIQNGNSLIDDASVAGDKAFKWDERFSSVMKEGGFDVVVGNPPYFNLDATFGKNSPVCAAIKARYPVIWQDKSDILFYFIAKAIEISNNKVSFIVSRSFLEADKAEKLRAHVLSTCKIVEIIDFGNLRVFQDANIATCIITLEKHGIKTGKIRVIKVKDATVNGAEIMETIKRQGNVYSDTRMDIFEFNQANLSGEPWNFFHNEYGKIISKLDKHPRIGDLFHIGEGMQTGCNEAFTIPQYLSNKYAQPRVRNSDIDSYIIRKPDESLIYPNDAQKFEELSDQAKKQLLSNEKQLKARAAFIRGNCEWYKFTFPLHKEYYSSPKIVFPYRAKSNKFALDEKAVYVGLTDTNVIFDKKNDIRTLKVLLAILNSKLMTFRFRNLAKLTGSGVYEYFENNVSRLPIAMPEKPAPFLALVDQMVSLKEKLLALGDKQSSERQRLEKEIEETDKKIDELVYDLYGLTQEERKIIKDSFKK